MSLDLFRPMPLIIVELHISETNGLDLRLTHQHRRLIIRKQAKLGFLAAAEPPKTAGGSAWPPRHSGCDPVAAVPNGARPVINHRLESKKK